MEVPLVDLKAQYQDLRHELWPTVEKTVSQGHYILGQEVELFEKDFAAFCGTKHCVGVSSGTDALHLSLRSLGIGPGDEVITVANTFAATAFAITYTGAKPVFVDVKPDDFNIDVDILESAINEKTKAIIPVHLYGHPARMDAILSLSKKYSLYVIEDACQAHGAEYNGSRVGSLGDIGCFSFYPGKNLGAYGDGGAAVTNNPELDEKLRLLRNYGQREKNVHSSLGFNSRLDTIQAAILRVKLKYLDAWNDKRRRVAQLYSEMLQGVDINLPGEVSGIRHVYHLYVVRHKQRELLLSELKNRKIFCGIHYPLPLIKQQPFLKAIAIPEGVPVATDLSKKILSLPMYPELNDTQIEYITDEIKNLI